MKASITLGHLNVLVAPLPSASKKNTSLKLLLILSWGLFHLFDLWCFPIDSAWILFHRDGDKMHIFTLCSILYISEKWTFYNFEVCAKRLVIKKKKEKYLISRNLKMGKPSKVIYKNRTFELGTKKYMGQNCGFAVWTSFSSSVNWK